MIDTKSLRDEQPLRVNHVVVAVARKFGAQAVARFAGTAIADGIWDDQIVFCAIEWQPAPEEFAAKIVKNGFSAAVRAVQQQHGIRVARMNVSHRTIGRPSSSEVVIG